MSKEVAIIRIEANDDGTFNAVEIWHNPDYDQVELLEVAVAAVHNQDGSHRVSQ